MVEQLRIYRAQSTDPYRNLATEKRLMDTTGENQCTLYLWQNQNTVVIGHNQNAWLECRTTLLEQEKGHLARRLSGGGAVFHDLGNLNFTFLMAKDNYNLDKQLTVIQTACAMAGITAERSGRNDILAEGRKFSGNAFYNNKTHAYHHGTLLVNADMDKLQRYLSPSKAKLQAKGVASVRSRVVNLQELSPGLDIGTMKAYMYKAFEDVYGLTAAEVTLSDSALADIAETARQYGSWEYLYGTPLPFTFACEDRFGWGQIRIELDAKNGRITTVKAYSDSMDWQISAAVEQALTGCAFRLADMGSALEKHLEKPIADDLTNLLKQQNL